MPEQFREDVVATRGGKKGSIYTQEGGTKQGTSANSIITNVGKEQREEVNDNIKGK